MVNLSIAFFISFIIKLFAAAFSSAAELKPVLPVCCVETNDWNLADLSLGHKGSVKNSFSSKSNFRSEVVISSILTAAVGIIAYWNKKEADRAYQSYLNYANSYSLQSEFRRAERSDRLAGSAFIAMEFGIGLTTYLLFFRE